MSGARNKMIHDSQSQLYPKNSQLTVIAGHDIIDEQLSFYSILCIFLVEYVYMTCLSMPGINVAYPIICKIMIPFDSRILVSTIVILEDTNFSFLSS